MRYYMRLCCTVCILPTGQCPWLEKGKGVLYAYTALGNTLKIEGLEIERSLYSIRHQ